MPAQRRIIVIWLPRLQSDLALRRLGLDAPFAVVDRQRGAERLVCLNARAEGLGLARGMGLADARALCPDLLTRPADPYRSAQALEIPAPLGAALLPMGCVRRHRWAGAGYYRRGTSDGRRGRAHGRPAGATGAHGVQHLRRPCRYARRGLGCGACRAGGDYTAGGHPYRAWAAALGGAAVGCQNADSTGTAGPAPCARSGADAPRAAGPALWRGAFCNGWIRPWAICPNP